MLDVGQYLPPITLTFYADHQSPHPLEVQTSTWADVVEMFSEHTFTPCAPCKGKSCPHKHGFAFSAVTLKPGTSRQNKNVVSLSLLTFDFDGLSRAELEGVCARLEGLESVLYSTHSHLHNGPDDNRVRIVIPLSRLLSPDEFVHVHREVRTRYGLEWRRPDGSAAGADSNAKDVSRLFFLPTAPEGSEVVFGHENGLLLNLDELLKGARPTQQASGVPPAPSVGTPFVAPVGTNMDVLRQVLKAYKPRSESDDVGVIPKKELVRRVLAAEPLVRQDERGQREKSCHRLGKILAHLIPTEVDDETVAELVRASIMSMPTYPDDGPDDVLDVRFSKLNYSLLRGRDERREKEAEIAAERAKEQVFQQKLATRFKIRGAQPELPVVASAGEESDPAGAATPPPAENDPEFEELAANWEQLLIYRKTKDGKDTTELKELLANCCTILYWHPEWREALRFNEITKDIDFAGGPLSKEDHNPTLAVIAVKNWLQSQYQVNFNSSDVRDAMMFVARGRAFNPLQDYLNGCVGDGVARLDLFLETYCGVSIRSPDEHDISDHVRRLSRRWLISCVARAMNPGCKVDTVLIFEGKTGIFKSSALKALAGEFFSDSKITVGTNEAMMAAGRNWIHELAELTAFRASDTEQQKSFFSSAVDTFRPPYAVGLQSFPRTCVFVGSTNEERYLNDVTGNRRYWPVRCIGRFELRKLERDRDRIWAEAVAAYRAGFECEDCAGQAEDARCEEHRWWLNQEENEVLEEVNRHRLKSNFADSIVRHLLRLPVDNRPKRYTLTEVATDMLSIPIERIPYQETAVARSLKALKFEHQRVMEDGLRLVYWYVPEDLRTAPRRVNGLSVLAGGKQ